MTDTPDAPKRTSERLPIEGTLRGQIMVFEPLLVREVSARGATIETSFPMRINSLHDVRLTLGDTSVVLKGRVTHSHATGVKPGALTYRSGLEFIEPAEPVLRVITTFLQGLKARRTTESSASDGLRMDLGRLSDSEAL
jgi:hypothetical protein